jgi:tetratricopeptide (TPR) repeat protein
MSCAPEKRRLLLQNSSRFQTWGLLVKLLEQSRDDIQDVPQTECLAELARTLADSLDPVRYGASLIEDMRARAWCYTGNARRLRSDLLGAEEALRNASSCLRLGTGDPVERARVLDFKASLCRDQRRFPEAASLLRRSFEVFIEAGEQHQAGRSLINLSTVHEHAGTPEQAIPLLHRAGDLIDRSIEPHLTLYVQHNIFNNLIIAGKILEAQRSLIQTRALYKQFSNPLMDARRNWAEAKLARALGQRQNAETLLLLAKRKFIAKMRPYSTALLSLDIASLYLDHGHAAKAADLAQEILPFFQGRGIQQEATAAARLLQAARESRTSMLPKM